MGGPKASKIRPLTEEQRQLAEQWSRLPGWIIRQNFYSWVPPHGTFDPADLLGIANLALVRAAALFDPQLGFKFSTYATAAISSTVWRHIAGQRKLKRSTYKHVPVHEDIADRRRQPDPPEIDGLTELLTEREMLIVRMRANGCTLETTGEALGVTRERVRQILNSLPSRINSRSARRPARSVPARAQSPPNPQ